MDQAIYQNHLNILKSELTVALGCTEPIAIAYVAARAKVVLEADPVSCVVRCSGNIIKNVMGVTVPNSGGQRGVDVAAVLGIVGGDPDKELAVLQSITQEHIDRAKVLLSKGFCRCKLVENVENLYIQVLLTDAAGNTAQVEAQEYHSNITQIIKNGRPLLSREEHTRSTGQSEEDKGLLSIQNILEFADCVRMEDIKDIIGRQIDYNTAISKEGLSCLLYTSPSPRDGLLSRMPSSA